MKTKRIALTPALSRPTGEGELCAAFDEKSAAGFIGRSFAIQKSANGCSLSHGMGEGQGEGKV
jgi:hypothetical protein